MRATVRNGGHTEWRGGPISLDRMFHFLSKPSPCSAYVAVRRVGRLSKCTPLRSSRDHRSSIFSLEGGLGGLPLRVSNEGLLLPSIYRHTFHPRESPDCPSLRASDEHSFIVRVLRARRMVWWLPNPILLRPRVHEHRYQCSLQARSFLYSKGGLVDPRMRASNEGFSILHASL